jgi:hypothetical protein
VQRDATTIHKMNQYKMVQAKKAIKEISMNNSTEYHEQNAVGLNPHKAVRY